MKLTQQECLSIYGVRALKLLPATRDQLQSSLKVSRFVANNTLQHLKSTDEVHVSGWAKSGCADAPIYSAGKGVDVVRPPAKAREKRVKIQVEKPQMSPPLPFKLPDRCHLKSKTVAPILTQWRTELPWKQNSVQT
jgi:hypothetical protein